MRHDAARTPRRALGALAAAGALLVSAAVSSAQAPPQERLVAIDPGHGAGDSGAVGTLAPGTQTGLPERRKGAKVLIYEKDVNLDVAQRLDRWLRERGYATLMTRTRDDRAGGDRPFTTVRADLAARVATANQAGATIFVSIHANSLNAKATGTETYHYYSAGRASRSLAKAIQKDLVARVGLPDRGVKRAGFYVLRHSAMPAVLVETGFLSNPDEAAVLASPESRQAMAEAIGTGVARHLANEPVGDDAAAAEPPPVKYWVTAGRSVSKRTAVRRAKAIRRAGLEALVRRRYSSRLDRNLHYVVTGQFSYLSNARSMRQVIRDLGLPGRIDSAVAPTRAGASRP